MGTKYICDSCGKEFEMKGCVGYGGYPASYETPAGKWAIVSYTAKAKEKPKPARVGQIVPYSPPHVSASYHVCSLACAEKVLAEIRTLLQSVFDEAVS
ncbi:MAG: hypothetical protein WC369_08490 [Dehalococcoidales bacterium]|jgi:hypothetical protein|nr:hypothetical protein [Dehalococcoidales bacterium]